LNVVVEKKSPCFSEGITTVFTVFNSVEYEGTLRRLDALSVNYLFKVIGAHLLLLKFSRQEPKNFLVEINKNFCKFALMGE
jgi:hypothetical protein